MFSCNTEETFFLFLKHGRENLSMPFWLFTLDILGEGRVMFINNLLKLVSQDLPAFEYTAHALKPEYAA